MPRVLLVAVAVAGGLLGCAHQPQGMSTAPQLVPLQIDAVPAQVEVFVDGASYGELQRWRGATLLLPAGPHRLELRSPGHFPLRRDLDLPPQGLALRATLRALPAP